MQLRSTRWWRCQIRVSLSQTNRCPHCARWNASHEDPTVFLSDHPVRSQVVLESAYFARVWGASRWRTVVGNSIVQLMHCKLYKLDKIRTLLLCRNR